MLFDKKFDLIFSLGEDCACTSYLRRFNLQDYSYPFDWLTKADFFTRMDLLVNSFKGFLEKKNLIFLDKSSFQNVDEHNDYYVDTKTDFYFYHDFDAKLSFDEAFILVKERYERRIKRLYEQIKISNNILIVWWSRDKHQNIKRVKKSYESLLAKYPAKNIDMLLIEFGEQPNKSIINSRGGGLCF